MSERKLLKIRLTARTHERLLILRSLCVCRVLSLSHAYESLEVQRRKDEVKLSRLDSKKQEQAERLGMGFGGRRSVSL